ncbi:MULTISPECIES: UDP-glucose 4-epimerase GalE [unclassified Pseudomonas]|uniref:UDP-galactose-4-epimerase n=1 Tax=Pseudomonas gorinensis TaxID=3240790 RepID=A0ACA7P377_9PSED|nr:MULTISPECIES: UDP-glucose 4-epimerase GalE [unclassified Pseudomonas]AHC34416.1 UDP-galactose-4-epimerase [Pseudomonas sp. TKP]MBL1309987.1 UDP-glucose 4-epimerase GalE [Pseudomonas sp.]PMX05320.1 UDP-glucose 4-epimerase GalE [Pseudomonas sp. MPBC4-3]PMX42154.1 UDP-glucose 4-epimerase GalE [Pseudomonas sp. FW301-21B01]PMY02846.1 UDP-glucose 4-epimerase GalE [Pseudomonas sp. MPR-R5A]
MKTVLVTGGAGYIGSHTLVECLQVGYQVVVLDDLSNSSSEVLVRIKDITGVSPIFFEGSVCDAELLTKLFSNYSIDFVIHFAGAKAVGESVEQPLKYYTNNVLGSIVLCQIMASMNVYKLVFSSSATVYGDSREMPLREDSRSALPINPYGRSKLMVEQMLFDLAHSDAQWSIAILRYFNPVGAHASGLIGEHPKGTPNNLFPYISQVAVGLRPSVFIFGNDYPTPDGTGIRDYIHVVDLAKGHLAALSYLDTHSGCFLWNLGTGSGYSVLEVINAFSTVSQVDIPFQYLTRRPGDLAECWSDPSKAKRDLGWVASLDLNAMVADSWRWQTLNPYGYGGEEEN